jgi:PilZ domain
MKKAKGPVKNFIARKSKRVHLKVRFKVNGRDQHGNQFEDHIETQDVSGNGGSFSTKWEIKVGSTLKMTGPKGFVSLVRVVWVKEDFKVVRRVVGFQLLEPRKDWVLQSQSRNTPLTPRSSKKG